MILVTGGSGYLGRALVEALLARGERVRVLCRSRSDIPAQICLGDITDPDSLDAAMQGVDVVYHLAALVDHYAPEERLHRVNVQGSMNVAEAAVRQGVGRLVHCSSVSAEPGGGSTVYGRSKIAAEQALQAYAPQLPLVILRPGPIYDAQRSNLQRLVRFARSFRLCPYLFPDGEVHLAWLPNVVAAFELAKAHGVPGHAYAICDREPIRRSQLARIVQQETGALALPIPSLLVFPFLFAAALGFEGMQRVTGRRPAIDRHYLKVMTRERRYDLRLARAELGYQPAATPEGLATVVRDILGDHTRVR